MLMFPPLVTTIARDLGVGLDQVFSMSFLMYLLYGLGAVPWGYLSDRWSPRLSMAAGMMIAGAGLAGAAAVKNPAYLPVMMAMTGLGNAAYHPAGLSLLSKGMRSRGKGLGTNGVWGNLGIALAPFVSGLLGWTFGWRFTFTVFGIAGLAAGAAAVLINFTVPRAEDRQKGEGPAGGKAVTLFLILCGGVIFSGMMYRTFTLVLPSWLEARMAVEFKGLAESLENLGRRTAGMDAASLAAALVSSGAMLIGMAGQIVGGRVADSRDLRKAYFVFFAMALPALLAARFVGGWMTVPFIGIYTFFALGMQPIENSLYAMLTPPRWRSSGFGVKFTLGFGMGSLAVAIVSRLQPVIGLNGIMVLASGYLAVTVTMAGVLLLTGGRLRIRHIGAAAVDAFPQSPLP
jgi:predicted MFS family arabinose efflux permease